MNKRLQYLQLEERALREQGKRAASMISNGNALDLMHIYSQALLSNQVEQTKLISMALITSQQEL